MTPDISSFMSDTSFWEFWGYVALGAVLIGVIGESIRRIYGLAEAHRIRKGDYARICADIDRGSCWRRNNTAQH